MPKASLIMPKLHASLQRANSVLTMLSRINRTIVRAETPDDLFRAACRISVECGLFDAAWVGLIEPGAGQFRVLASTDGIESIAPQLAGRAGLAAKVRRSGEMTICSDLNSLSDGAERAALQDIGLHAAAGLPLRENGEVVAVLMVFSRSAGCFDHAVLNLLAEVADDISFSLDHQLSDQHRLAAESKLYYMASYDAQTGMPNRSLLDERLPHLARRAVRKAECLALLNVRLQRLDKIAQILGPAAMDEVMRTIALRLQENRSADGLLAQLSPEEFALASTDFKDAAEISAFAQTVRHAIEQPIAVDGKEVFLHAAIGAVIHGVHEQEIAYLLRRARTAARTIDAEGGFRLYSPDLDRDLAQHVEMEAELHRALEREEFQLHYQPQINVKSGRVIGVEALLRWQHPQRGLIPPGQFIPLLEESGLMSRVGTWVLKAACRQAREWERQGLPALRMAVNLSAQQFRLADLVQTVRQALDEAGLDPALLELELTESLILENAEQTIHTMHELKKLGVSLSLDDFGTGYSSLSYLRRYPVDRIKIDQSFVRDMEEHKGSAALVRSILAMAHNLGLETIAEGVETETQLGYLRKQACQEMQGYFFSKPLPGEELTRLLREGRKLSSQDPLEVASSTLLVAGGDPGIAFELQDAVRREGLKPLSAASGTAALGLLASNNIGVVAASSQLPDMPGTEFLQRVREMYPQTVRILVAANPDAATVIDAVNSGELFRILCMPASGEAIRSLVRDAFRRYESNAETMRLHSLMQEMAGPAMRDDRN